MIVVFVILVHDISRICLFHFNRMWQSIGSINICLFCENIRNSTKIKRDKRRRKKNREKKYSDMRKLNYKVELS